MGSWGAGISGNDTAMDLRSEYQAAFYYFDVETALEKIDAYVRREGFDELYFVKNDGQTMTVEKWRGNT